MGKKGACRQTLLRKPIKINSCGPKAKKEDVININVFLLPTKRRKPPSLPSHPSQSAAVHRGTWEALKGKHSSREIDRYWEGFLYSVLTALLRLFSINSCHGYSDWLKCAPDVALSFYVITDSAHTHIPNS